VPDQRDLAKHSRWRALELLHEAAAVHVKEAGVVKVGVVGEEALVAAGGCDETGGHLGVAGGAKVPCARDVEPMLTRRGADAQ
jgi:hypothetical protein